MTRRLALVGSDRCVPRRSREIFPTGSRLETRDRIVEAALVLGALQNLFFEWTHREDFPIAEGSTHTARLLADALAPTADELAKRR